jgi:lipopolysaccharide biosynthesis protein
MKIAVCVHLYHIDMWDTIQNYLNNLIFDYTLIVNLPVKNENGLPEDFDWEFYVNYYQDLQKAGKNTYNKAITHYLKNGEIEKRVFSKKNFEITEKIKNYKKDAIIILTPNKGMDIGGFLYSYKNIEEDVDLILKIHTKKGVGSEKNPSLVSRRVGLPGAEKIGRTWFNHLMSGVLGSKEQVNKIINKFKTDPKCGMVGYKKYNNFNVNELIINEILPHLGISKHTDNVRFVGGTIFWVKNDILKPYLTEKNLDYLLGILPYGYVDEPSVNHAMERIFGSFVYNQNKELMIIK